MPFLHCSLQISLVVAADRCLWPITASSRCRAESMIQTDVGNTKRTPLKGKRFVSLQEGRVYFRSVGNKLGRYPHPWHDQAAGFLCGRKTNPAALAAGAFPLLPIRRTRGGCVEVEAAYYSAPPGWIGRTVKVHWDSIFVRILDPKTGQLMIQGMTNSLVVPNR